jgi:hypothetical protein
MSLSIIKNSFLNGANILKTNRFLVDMTLFNPKKNKFVRMTNEPVVRVGASSLSLITRDYVNQNIPIKVPRKFQSAYQVEMTFYLRESLNVFNELTNLVKQYGGQRFLQAGPGGQFNRPLSYTQNSMYNTAIRNNTAKLKLITDGATNAEIDPRTGEVNHIEYLSFYPDNILPISLESTGPTTLATFSVTFGFATEKTSNELDLGPIFE